MAIVQTRVRTTVAPSPRADVPADVLDRARRGDQEAFADLIRHYDRGLRALAYRVLADPDRMDDALQEAYVKAFRALPRFRGESKLGTWLYRIAYNACLDELERGRRVVQLPLDELGEHAAPAVDLAEAVTARGDLEAALASLSPEERATVLLVDADGFDYRDAGEILGVPSGTIASRLNRARSALRRSLADVPAGAEA